MSVQALERELPPATLLLGPDLEKLLHIARVAVLTHGVALADRVTLLRLSAVNARYLIRFVGTAPFGPFKAVIIVLDEATSQAQNILLKILEEPPETVRFILAATARPLPTVMSRCQVIIVPVAETGQDEAPGEVTGAVAAALKAARAGDLLGLDSALKGWGDEQHTALKVRLTETSLSGDDAGERRQVRRLLGILSQYDDAHPRLAAHAALIIAFDREQHA